MLFQTASPPLIDLCSAIQDHLCKCFNDVKCSVVDCPDLSAQPYALVGQGLGGQSIICDVGSFDNLFPSVNPDKKYSLTEVFKHSSLTSGYFIGAAAGPFHLIGTPCELAVNVKFDHGKVSQIGSYSGIHHKDTDTAGQIKMDNDIFTLLGHMLLTEGKPGKVIEVKASCRTCNTCIVTCLREALTNRFAKLSDGSSTPHPVGMGGVILQTRGKAKYLIQPEFSKEPLDSPEKIAKWAKFYEMDAPIVAVGTMLSHDPDNLGLKLEHFHCFSSSRDKAGHYVSDISPEEVEFTIYLVPGSSLLRYDQPGSTSH